MESAPKTVTPENEGHWLAFLNRAFQLHLREGCCIQVSASVLSICLDDLLFLDFDFVFGVFKWACRTHGCPRLGQKLDFKTAMEHQAMHRQTDERFEPIRKLNKLSRLVRTGVVKVVLLWCACARFG